MIFNTWKLLGILTQAHDTPPSCNKNDHSFTANLSLSHPPYRLKISGTGMKATYCEEIISLSSETLGETRVGKISLVSAVIRDCPVTSAPCRTFNSCCRQKAMMRDRCSVCRRESPGRHILSRLYVPQRIQEQSSPIQAQDSRTKMARLTEGKLLDRET